MKRGPTQPHCVWRRRWQSLRRTFEALQKTSVAHLTHFTPEEILGEMYATSKSVQGKCLHGQAMKGRQK